MSEASRHPAPHNQSKPHMLLQVARDFPELKIIAAHLGGLNMWDSVDELLAGIDNVFMGDIAYL